MLRILPDYNKAVEALFSVGVIVNIFSSLVSMLIRELSASNYLLECAAYCNDAHGPAPLPAKQSR